MVFQFCSKLSNSLHYFLSLASAVRWLSLAQRFISIRTPLQTCFFLSFWFLDIFPGGQLSEKRFLSHNRLQILKKPMKHNLVTPVSSMGKMLSAILCWSLHLQSAHRTDGKMSDGNSHFWKKVVARREMTWMFLGRKTTTWSNFRWNLRSLKNCNFLPF